MPLVGTKPSDQPIRRRNKPGPESQWREVEDVPFEGGPPLPKTEPGLPSWPTQTKRWWKVISRMPHCVLWTDSDWRFAIDTAYVSAAFHRGDLKQADSLMKREKVLGTTMDFRRDLRIRYVEPKEPEQAAGITAIQEYRDRLGAAEE